MFSPETIAWLATLCVAGSYLFQVRKALLTKQLEDVSWLFLSVISLGNLLWVYYGFLRNDMTFVASNIVIALFVFALIFMKALYRGRARP